MTQLLLDTPLNMEQQQFVATIRNGGEVLLALIDEILDFSRVESDRLELTPRTFDLHRCVEEVVDLLAGRATEKAIKLAVGVSKLVPQWVVGDEIRLRQILVNLLGNAIKFTQQGVWP